MTAQSSGAESGPCGPRRLASPVRESSPLDRLLRTGVHGWGGPAALTTSGADTGFAALRFDAAPDSAHRTRNFLRATLKRWRLDRLVDDATTVAAELVANAVTHALCPHRPPHVRAAGAAWLALVREEQGVVCAVADPSPSLPAMREADPFAESGRGLHIVAELSETWGHARSEGPGGTGKTVWARLAGGR